MKTYSELVVMVMTAFEGCYGNDGFYVIELRLLRYIKSNPPDLTFIIYGLTFKLKCLSVTNVKLQAEKGFIPSSKS